MFPQAFRLFTQIEVVKKIHSSNGSTSKISREVAIFFTGLSFNCLNGLGNFVSALSQSQQFLLEVIHR